VLFKPDEQLDAIVSAKAGHCAGAMLVDSGEDVGRHSSVESAVALGGKKVDAGLEVGVHWGLFSWVPAFAGMTNFCCPTGRNLCSKLADERSRFSESSENPP
jgi:hypothetical protein